MIYTLLDCSTGCPASKMKTFLIFIVIVTLQKTVAMENNQKCRDRDGYFSPETFTARACTNCYDYLHGRLMKPVRADRFGQFGWGLVVLPTNRTHGRVEQVIFANPANQSSMDAVCSYLSTDECSRWTQCCETGVECCQAQQLQSSHEANATSVDPDHCPMVWDGWSCWGKYSAGEEATQQCPTFLSLSLTSRDSLKVCTENGTWSSKEGKEWTDYTSCLDVGSYLVGVNICISINVLSLFFIVPAIIIFIYFRDLFRQNRVRIHIHLLVALGLCCLATTLWYVLVHRNLLVSGDSASTVISQNPIWCQTLAVLKLYLSSSTYWWMLCEGVYLHRLLVHAFHPPKSLIFFCLLGWGCPAVCVLIYAGIRGPQNNENCWANHFGHMEWIIYVPNLFCLVGNLFILFNILRILLCQIHGHPHEPSNFRKGVKAAFMLIPLFGLQLLLTLYRPKLDHSWQAEYENFTYIVTNSQGIFVSIIFCYLNGEVLANFRRKCPCQCLGVSRKWGTQHSVVNTTQFTLATEDTDESPRKNPINDKHESMKLQPVSNNYPHLITTSTENGDKGMYQAML